MFSLTRNLFVGHASRWFGGLAISLALGSHGLAADKLLSGAETAGVKDAAAMKPYLETIIDSDGEFEMLPIPGGKFKMGSPDGEEKRGDDEGPVHEVEIAPFWMAKHEVSWDEYEVFMFQLDVARRKIDSREPTAADKAADACSKPTKPYTDMTFGMGKEKHPVICMTQYSAMKYCEWLSKKTGRYYRLPTEAEWEYACRAGTTTKYSFGDDESKLVGCQESAQSAEAHGTVRRARRLLGRRSRAPAQRGPRAVDGRLEAARPADPAKHLVLHGRLIRRLPRHSPARATLGGRKGQDLGRRPAAIIELRFANLSEYDIPSLPNVS